MRQIETSNLAPAGVVWLQSCRLRTKKGADRVVRPKVFQLEFCSPLKFRSGSRVESADGSHFHLTGGRAVCR